MPKKRKSKSAKHRSEEIHYPSIERSVVENLVQLQKVHTDLAEKFDKLSKEISNLLALFEMTARNFSQHPAIQTSDKDKEFLEKIDKLLEQNKTIAKGLTLMESRIRDRVYGHSESSSQSSPQSSQPPQETEEKYYPSQSGKPLPHF